MIEVFVVIVVAVSALAVWAGLRAGRGEAGEALAGGQRSGTPAVAPRMTTTPRGFPRVDMGPVRLAAAGHRLAVSGDDFRDAPKQIENLNMELRIAYRNAAGDDSVRAVIVERAYGPSPARLTHVRGLDTKSDERRTFRLDRIVAAHDPAADELLNEDIGRLIWGEALAVSGVHPMDVDARGQVATLSGSARIRFANYDGKDLVFLAELHGAEYSSYGWLLVGRARRTKEDNPGHRAWSGEKRFAFDRIREFVDMDTGEVVEDVRSWARERISEWRTEQ